MKTLRCEMCNGTDLVKEDGVYVCMYCGTKYSVEDARKLMIEGTVDVTGSAVKIDNSKKLSNLYQLARRATTSADAKAALSYYEAILIEDPNSWEATIYASFLKYKDCKCYELFILANQMMKSTNVALFQIKKYVEPSDYCAALRAIEKVSSLCDMFSRFVYDNAIQYYYNASNPKGNFKDTFLAAVQIMYNLGNSLVYYFGDNERVCKVDATAAWNAGIQMSLDAMENGQVCAIFLLDSTIWKDVENAILTYADKIKQYDPSYQAPKFGKSGCYIATAVYGSYDCPQVWTLRRYRDYILNRIWLGRLFVYFYYLISPFLVKHFGQKDWFKKMWKRKLDRMVEYLNSKGIENTPYRDKNW